MIGTTSSWPPGDFEAQAAYWLALLMSDDASPAVRKAFEVWRDKDIKHAEAFERASAVWQATDALSLDPDISDLRREILSDAFRPKRRFTAALATIAALFVIGVVSSVMLPSFVRDTPVETTTKIDEVTQVIVADMTIRDTFATDMGEFKTVVLPDGSIMDLNADTQVEIAFGGQTRTLNMTKGQAVFKVAHDKERPFTVLAAGRTITALGTEFEVIIDRSDLSVTLVEGKVVVDQILDASERFRPDTISKAVELRPGQVLRAKGQREASIQTANANEAGAWRRRSLAFNGEEFETVALLLNRYSDKKIIIEDESLRNLEIGGTYKVQSRDGLIAAMTGFYPVEVLEDPTTGNIHFKWSDDQEVD
ncbi:MAG: FecR family protein [Henriciella sp.]